MWVGISISSRVVSLLACVCVCTHMCVHACMHVLFSRLLTEVELQATPLYIRSMLHTWLVFNCVFLSDSSLCGSVPLVKEISFFDDGIQE